MKVLRKFLAVSLCLCLGAIVNISISKAFCDAVVYEDKNAWFDQDLRVIYWYTINYYTLNHYYNVQSDVEITGFDVFKEKIPELIIPCSFDRAANKVKKISGDFDTKNAGKVVLPETLKILSDFKTNCESMQFPASLQKIENCEFTNLKSFEIVRSVNGVNTLKGVLKGIPEGMHCYLRGVVDDVVHFDIVDFDEYSPMECCADADVVNETAEFIFNSKSKPLRF